MAARFSLAMAVATPLHHIRKAKVRHLPDIRRPPILRKRKSELRS
jgi:hypothetical protein